MSKAERFTFFIRYLDSQHITQKPMPALIEIANKLALKFIESDNKKRTAKHVVHEIDCLIYTTSKKPVDQHTKRLIIHVIYELLNGQRPLPSQNGKPFNIKPEHISLFIKASNKLMEQG